MFSLTDDTFAPQLLFYSLNMTSREVLLIFSEDIEPSSVNVTGITIQGTTGVTNNTSLFYRLTSAQSIPVVMNSTVRIVLSDLDYNALQSRLGIATSQSNTYLSMDPGTVTDRSPQRNMVQAVTSQPVSNYYQDILPPSLLDFSLDLNAGTMTLTFSEPVLIGSLSPQHIVISSQPDLSDLYVLTGGSVLNSNILATSVVEIRLSRFDLNSLKLNRNVATGISNTYLSVSSEFATDTNHNNNTASNGIRASSFTPDTTSPELQAFEFDLNSGVLLLTFSEPVNASSFNASALTLQSSSAVAEVYYHLLNLSYVASNDGPLVFVILSETDLNAIKQISALCTNPSNCFIAVTESVASDLNGLHALAIPSENALAVSIFTPDFVSPVLISWILDVDSGILSLSFSETVNASSSDLTELSLQSASANFSAAVSLTNSITSSINSPVIMIFLSANDLNTLKRLTNLGTGADNSFLSFTENFIRDMSGNAIEPVSYRAALQVESYIRDITQPSLESFSLNITSGILSMTFSETVNSSSFISSGLTIIVNEIPTNVTGVYSTYTRTLSGGSLVSLVNDQIVIFALSQHDLNALTTAMGDLATSNSTTYLAATSETIRDMVRIPLVSIPLSHPLPESGNYGTYGKYE